MQNIRVCGYMDAEVNWGEGVWWSGDIAVRYYTLADFSTKSGPFVPLRFQYGPNLNALSHLRDNDDSLPVTHRRSGERTATELRLHSCIVSSRR